MSSMLHQRLLNEATHYGTGEILHRMPVAYSLDLEQAIREGVSQAVFYYAEGLESLDQQRHPLENGT